MSGKASAPENDRTDARLLLLHPDDNVLVARGRIRAGESFSVAGRACQVDIDLPLGHKIARQAIAAGEKVLKYGAPIGTASEAIPAGARVHVHNLKSDYTPTFYLPPEDGAGTRERNDGRDAGLPAV